MTYLTALTVMFELGKNRPQKVQKTFVMAADRNQKQKKKQHEKQKGF